MMTVRLSLALAVTVSFSTLALGEDEKAKEDEKAEVEHRWVRARVTGGTGQGVGIQAKKLPSEFTIPEGRTARNFKYRLDDPKSNYTSDKLTRSSIYSITEKRYIREAENNPKLELPPGKYRFIVGGRPGAQGSLAFDLVSDDTPPADDGPDSPPKPEGKEVLLNLPQDFDVVYDQDPWNKHPWVFRFRGDQVTGRTRFVREYPGSNGERNIHTYHFQIEGVFRRGVLTSQYMLYYTAGHFGGADSIGLYAKTWMWGTVSAQADSDTATKGMLKVVVDIRHHKHLGRRTPQRSGEAWGPWRDETARMQDPNQVASPWKPSKLEIVLQLPVRQPQLSQKLQPEEDLPPIPEVPQ